MAVKGRGGRTFVERLHASEMDLRGQHELYRSAVVVANGALRACREGVETSRVDELTALRVLRSQLERELASLVERLDPTEAPSEVSAEAPSGEEVVCVA